MLGRDLTALLASEGEQVTGLGRDSLDIADPGAVAAALDRHQPSVVVNCAAWTAVDDAEAHEADALRINGDGAANLATACARAGAALIQPSTDYVFDGHARTPYAEGDPTGPRSAYGRTKLAGERAVLAALPEASEGVVVRTAWLYTGGTGKDFVAVMRRLAAGDGPVNVVDDQTGSPTYVADLAAALLQVADDRVPGPILHAANEGAVSRFEQARAVFEECGADPARVRPVSTDQFPRPAPRPTYSALSSRESAAAGLTPLRPWRPALVAALAPSASDAAADRPIPSTRD
jgi:dTDP-4-dehydrorhamnose reductase